MYVSGVCSNGIIRRFVLNVWTCLRVKYNAILLPGALRDIRNSFNMYTENYTRNAMRDKVIV